MEDKKKYLTKEQYQKEMAEFLVESANDLRTQLRARWKENAQQAEYV